MQPATCQSPECVAGKYLSLWLTKWRKDKYSDESLSVSFLGFIVGPMTKKGNGYYYRWFTWFSFFHYHFHWLLYAFHQALLLSHYLRILANVSFSFSYKRTSVYDVLLFTDGQTYLENDRRRTSSAVRLSRLFKFRFYKNFLRLCPSRFFLIHRSDRIFSKSKSMQQYTRDI